MKKALKIILVIVVLLVGAVVGIGFGTDATFDQRFPVVIDAPIAKVYALLGDPKRTPEWLPKEAGDIDTVEIAKTSVLAKAAGAAIDSALGGGTNNGKDVPTHTYHMKDGTSLEMRTVENVPEKKCTERIVGGTNQFASMFKSMTWGFEMEPADAGKTKLTVVSAGEAGKPIPNFVNHVMTWMHMGEKNAEKMAKNVEVAAKK